MADTGVIHYLQSGDGITRGVALVLLAMSVASWCFLIVKAWVLTRAKRQGPHALKRFWQAATLADGIDALRATVTVATLTRCGEKMWVSLIVPL